MNLCKTCGKEFIDFCKPCAVRAAMRNIRRQDALRGLACSQKQTRQARGRALIELDDPELATKIVLGDPDSYLRRASLMFIRDKETLMEVIYTDEDWQVRQVAISCLKDEALLKEVMKGFAQESTNYRFAKECLMALKANSANLTNR